MAPKKAPPPPAAESSEEESSEDDLPSSDDDVESPRVDVPPKTKPGGSDVKEGATQPLLADGNGGKQAASDLAAGAEEELKKLAESDPAAAQALEMAQKLKDDPKAAALAAAEAVKNYKPPTAEELKASAEAAKAEAKEAAEAAKKLWEDMMNDRPPPIWPMAPVSKRMDRYLNLLVEAIPEGKVPPAVQQHLKPGLEKTVQVCTASSGWCAFVTRWITRIWNMLPTNIVMMVFGVALCYFGGTFTTSIAAAEAFRTMGGEKALADIDSVVQQLKPVLEANDKDDEMDEDGDGVADVDELTPPQLLQRKVILVFTTVKEPQKIQAAVGSVYGALLAVLATLKLEFAATTAMAMGVADMLKKPLFKFVVPALEKALPQPTHQWIVPAIDSALRLAAMAIAWYIQQIISAFYSALRGGKMFSQALFNIVISKAKKGIVLCPGVIGPDFDPDGSIIDDLIGWIIAAQGFMFQLNSGFTLSFPFNIIFAPLTFLEWYLKFQISSEVMSSRQLAADEPLQQPSLCM